MARKGVAKHGLSIRMACVVYGISETCYRYQPKLSGENALVADWLLRLTQTHKRWGFGLCFLYLRNVKGYTWNHKRVYRIYRETGAEPTHQAPATNPAGLSGRAGCSDRAQPGLVDGFHE